MEYVICTTRNALHCNVLHVMHMRIMWCLNFWRSKGAFASNIMQAALLMELAGIDEAKVGKHACHEGETPI